MLYLLHCEVGIAEVTHFYLISSSGLESYPQLELAKKQMTGFGGMVTFFIKGDVENSKQFFKASKVRLCFVLCVNALLYEAEKRLVVETQIVALSLTWSHSAFGTVIRKFGTRTMDLTKT